MTDAQVPRSGADAACPQEDHDFDSMYSLELGSLGAEFGAVLDGQDRADDQPRRHRGLAGRDPAEVMAERVARGPVDSRLIRGEGDNFNRGPA